jgi:hypothetical protein
LAYALDTFKKGVVAWIQANKRGTADFANQHAGPNPYTALRRMTPNKHWVMKSIHAVGSLPAAVLRLFYLILYPVARCTVSRKPITH